MGHHENSCRSENRQGHSGEDEPHHYDGLDQMKAPSVSSTTCWVWPHSEVPLDHVVAVNAHDKLMSQVEGTSVVENRLVGAETVLCFGTRTLVLLENCHVPGIGILPFDPDAQAVRNVEMILVTDREKHGLKIGVGYVNALLGDSCFREEPFRVVL